MHKLCSITTNKSFSQVSKDHNAPTKHYLIYFRLQNCLTANTSIEGALPTKLWNYFFTEHSNTKGTSLIYSLLQKKNMFHKSKPLLDWEKDLQIQFTDAQWQTAITSIYKAITCTSLWELTQKTLMRWYLTPSRLATFHKHTSHECWRNCGKPGTLLHILWSCPHVSQLWKEVEIMLQTIMLQDTLHSLVALTAQLAIPNLNIDDIPTYQRSVTTHILLATKLLIT